MRIPVLKGTIKRRLLVNYRADPAVVQRILPPPFRPKLQMGFSIVGICLIRLEGIRPTWFPVPIGISSENAAHRIAVEWCDREGATHEGVYIPRRDTGSLINRLAGGRAFPGEHHPARFSVTDDGREIDLSMQALDGSISVRVAGRDSSELTGSSCFGSLGEASRYFEGGSLGFSATRHGHRLDGLLLKALEWRVNALNVSEVRSSYFEEPSLFPKGSVAFDHALVMRDIRHEWHSAEDVTVGAAAA